MPRFIGDRKKHALHYRDAEASQDGVCRCVYCNIPVVLKAQTTNWAAASIEHLHPRSLGGHKTDPMNLAVACYRCNHAKGDMPLADWVAKCADPGAVWARIVRLQDLTKTSWQKFNAMSKADGWKD